MFRGGGPLLRARHGSLGLSCGRLLRAANDGRTIGAPGGEMCIRDSRKTLRNFLRGAPERVFPVGRLDYAASGLVLLTSDGQLTARVLRASARLRQTYWIKVKGRISESAVSYTHLKSRPVTSWPSC